MTYSRTASHSFFPLLIFSSPPYTPSYIKVRFRKKRCPWWGNAFYIFTHTYIWGRVGESQVKTNIHAHNKKEKREHAQKQIDEEV